MAELTRRYIVMPMATEGPFDLQDPEGVFVLKPWKDPAALVGLMAYRDHCYAELALELEEWINAIREGPVARGGVGARNEQFLADRPRPKSATRPAARPKAKAQKKQSKSLKKKAKRR